MFHPVEQFTLKRVQHLQCTLVPIVIVRLGFRLLLLLLLLLCLSISLLLTFLVSFTSNLQNIPGSQQKQTEEVYKADEMLYRQNKNIKNIIIKTIMSRINNIINTCT